MQFVDIEKQFDVCFMIKAPSRPLRVLAKITLFSLQKFGVSYTHAERKNIGHRIGLREKDDLSLSQARPNRK